MKEADLPSKLNWVKDNSADLFSHLNTYADSYADLKNNIQAYNNNYSQWGGLYQENPKILLSLRNPLDSIDIVEMLFIGQKGEKSVKEFRE